MPDWRNSRRWWEDVHTGGVAGSGHCVRNTELKLFIQQNHLSLKLISVRNNNHFIELLKTLSFLNHCFVFVLKRYDSIQINLNTI